MDDLKQAKEFIKYLSFEQQKELAAYTIKETLNDIPDTDSEIETTFQILENSVSFPTFNGVTIKFYNLLSKELDESLEDAIPFKEMPPKKMTKRNYLFQLINLTAFFTFPLALLYSLGVLLTINPPLWIWLAWVMLQLVTAVTSTTRFLYFVIYGEKRV